MATTTIFIAVQCCQCFTMQVKQQKKSSNKWVCVVCNKRQSVRRIHARGPLARDVRRFVQAFNISRSELGSNEPDPTQQTSDGFPSWSHAAEKRNVGNFESHAPAEKKRRMDWSEYMDPQDADKEDDGEIVTELRAPQKFRGSIANAREEKCNSRQSNFKPVFSKRQKVQQTSLEERNQSQGIRTLSSMIQKSKWNEYLEEGEGSAQGSLGIQGYEEWSYGRREQYSDLTVEEEVHPDFM